MPRVKQTMNTYIVELDHGRTRTITEVEARSFDEAVSYVLDIQGYGVVMSVQFRACSDSIEFPQQERKFQLDLAMQ